MGQGWRGVLRPPIPRSRVAKRIERTGATGLEPATSGVTGRRSNQLNYAPERPGIVAVAQRGETVCVGTLPE